MLLAAHRLPTRSSQRGLSLIEALITTVVFAFGMLGAAQMNTAAINAGAQSKTTAAALDLADQKIEQLRNLNTLANYSALANSSTPEPFVYNQATFSRSWTVNKLTAAGAPRYARVAVTVNWQDSDGIGRSVTLDSNIAEPDPGNTGKWYDSALKEHAHDQAASGSPESPPGDGEGEGDD